MNAIVNIDKRLISFLEQRRIFFDRQVDHLKNCRISFKNGEKIEPYCGFYGIPKDGSIVICKTGSFSYSNSHLKQDMKIGRYCSIAENLDYFGGQHPPERLSTSPFVFNHTIPFLAKALEDKGIHDFKSFPKTGKGREPIVICNDVWIGKGVALSEGIRIGNGAIIGAKSVVTRDVPDYAIVAGVPAKIIRYRFDQDVIARLFRIKWWDYHFADFNGIDFTKNIHYCLDEIESLIAKGIKKYEPEALLVSISKEDPNCIIFQCCPE